MKGIYRNPEDGEKEMSSRTVVFMIFSKWMVCTFQNHPKINHDILVCWTNLQFTVIIGFPGLIHIKEKFILRAIHVKWLNFRYVDVTPTQVKMQIF